MEMIHEAGQYVDTVKRVCGAAAFGCTLLPVNNLLRLVCAVAAGAAVYAVAIIASGEGRAEAQAVLKRLKR